MKKVKKIKMKDLKKKTKKTNKDRKKKIKRRNINKVTANLKTKNLMKILVTMTDSDVIF